MKKPAFVLAALLLAAPLSATTVRSVSSNTAATGTAVSVSAPTGTAAGDVVIVAVHANGNISISDNNGATPFANDLVNFHPNAGAGQTLAVFSRRIVSGDPTTYRFTLSAGGRWTAEAVTFQNPDATAIYDVAPTGGNNRDDTATNTGTAISITTVNDKAIHCALFGPDGASNAITGVPAGYTVQLNTGNQALVFVTRVITPPGATGAQTFTYTSNDSYLAASFAIRDNAAAPAAAPHQLLLRGVGL